MFKFLYQSRNKQVKTIKFYLIEPSLFVKHFIHFSHLLIYNIYVFNVTIMDLCTAPEDRNFESLRKYLVEKDGVLPKVLLPK